MFLPEDDGASHVTICSLIQRIFVERLYMSGTMLGTCLRLTKIRSVWQKGTGDSE